MSTSGDPDALANATARAAERMRGEQDAEAWALSEADKHQPEPGGCTCGFCAWSVEHVLITVLSRMFECRVIKPLPSDHRLRIEQEPSGKP